MDLAAITAGMKERVEAKPAFGNSVKFDFGDDGKIHIDGNNGNAVTNDTRLFEKICLEGFQSGLSWLTILRKRDNFRAAFANFDFHKVAKFDDADIERLVADAGIVRHRGKIVSTINNANRAIE